MKHALLSYSFTDNIGDEIQSLAARRFLPSNYFLLNRERLNKAPYFGENAFIILNGWFCHHPIAWPPASHLRPLLISFYLSDNASFDLGLRPSEVLLQEPLVNYFKKLGPVGARDLHTLKLLQDAGVESYFSGCLTLTLDRPDVARSADLLVLCDVPKEVEDYVRRVAQGKQIVRVTHRGYDALSPEARFAAAEDLLRTYAKAAAVLTTRLHCALPCTAIGTPVLLLDEADDQERFSGLNDFVRHCRTKAFLSRAFDFDLNSPTLNPDSHLETRHALIARVSHFIEQSQNGVSPEFPLSEHDLRLHQIKALNLMSTELHYLRERLVLLG